MAHVHTPRDYERPPELNQFVCCGNCVYMGVAKDHAEAGRATAVGFSLPQMASALCHRNPPTGDGWVKVTPDDYCVTGFAPNQALIDQDRLRKSLSGLPT